MEHLQSTPDARASTSPPPVEPPRGLTGAEAALRLRDSGPNELQREAAVSPWSILLGQLKSPLVALLFAAAVVAGLLGERADAIAIGAIMVLNALVGFFQEYRAERAVMALRSMTAPRARVVRDGRSVVIPSTEVVPGDLLLLEAGDVVAADGSLHEAAALTMIEASLTGESLPVEKSTTPAAANAPLAERHDHVFSGTSVATGTGMAEVVATGMQSELGRIAHLLATAKSGETPLKKRLEAVSRKLIWLCLAVVGVVLVLGLARGDGVLQTLLLSVSLAVAAVPEGLPAVVTIALAIGVQRMASRNVLVRRLHAVETLGCATVICTDKTGTLTTGKMAVRDLWGPDRQSLLDAAAACVDAELSADDRTGVGDPMEVALLAAAAVQGIRREEIERTRTRRTVLPFDSSRRRMSVLRSDGVLYMKGAVETLLELCTTGGEGALRENEEMAKRGLRVLAIAVGKGPEERGLRLLGLIGIADPPRSEAIDAIATARAAGIRTVMITGDHPVTARAIAAELGLLAPGEDPSISVHARATAEDKIRIVREWKEKGAIVAMTGDGVNDAPALREAHVGIAMGKTGTEVTREAASVILSDDNYASIIAAVREGRGIYDNIRKTLVYLLSGNAAEMGVMVAAMAAGLPAPLIALQILWINLVTDGLPALALVTDPPDADVMTRKPRPHDEAILRKPQVLRIALTGLLEAVLVLAVFIWALDARGLLAAQSFAFSVLVFSELFRAFAARSETRTFWETGAFTNLRLLGVVVVSIALQIGLHHVPIAQQLFRVEALTGMDCLMALGLGLIPVSVIESMKLLRRIPLPFGPRLRRTAE